MSPCSIPYALNFVDKSTDDLINETINDLAIPESHKRLVRNLPNELNVLSVAGVSQYNIAKLEAISDVFDRVENGTNVFMYEDYPNDIYDVFDSDVHIPIRTFSQEKIDSVARHAFALASAIDFNKDTVEYHDSDFQRVAEALNDVTDKTLIGRDYEPFFGPARFNKTYCEDRNIPGGRRFDRYVICIDGITYGITELGESYDIFVNTDKDFYLRNKGEDIAIQAIQDYFGNPVVSLSELSNDELNFLYDNNLLRGVRDALGTTGASLSYGNLRLKSNADNVDIGTNFNIYNIAKLYVGDASTPQEIAERFLENRRDGLSHFSRLPHLVDNIGYPIGKIKEVEALRNIYQKYDNVTSVAWIPPIFYLLPEELDGMTDAGSVNFSGTFSSVLNNFNIPSIQLHGSSISPEIFTFNISEIFSDFDNDGFPERIFVEGNVVFGDTIPDFCRTFIPYETFEENFSVGNTRNADTPYCSSN